jgi:AraC family transcriptional regulator, regulatory protein of adaptative response / DNA-3-methyladenine glycosylase II
VLDRQVCDRARIARDARFDGQFFTGVVTTRIYCRPICPVRPARSENVRFYPSAAAAEGAGFRPCLRCRPELAPDLDPLASVALVARGLKLINRGFLDEHRVHELASELAVGERQLTRLFRTQLGTTPGATAQTRRVQLAKRLLDETEMPITQIAFAAGFSSIRRFNAAFVATYGRSPGGLRRGSQQIDAQAPIAVRLAFRPPYDWASLVALLKADAIPGVEVVTSSVYQRTVSVDGRPGWFAVSPIPGENSLRLRLHLPDGVRIGGFIERVRGMLDLSANPRQIQCQLSRHLWAAQLLSRAPGLRLPGAWDGFEVAVRVLVVEDIGHDATEPVLRRLVLRHGQGPLGVPAGGPTMLFPTPTALTQASFVEDGLSGRTGERIQHLARAVIDRTIVFEPSVTFDDLACRLERIGGFDQPTAHWIAMRSLSEPDAQPFGTRAVCGLATWDHSMFAEHQEWRPWRSYIAVSLILDRHRQPAPI